VLCLFGGFGCSIVSDEEEAIRVLCDLIFLIILRDKQKNNAKHSLAAIETITTSQHSFLSIIICGFFINYLTLFLDGRNERHSGSVFSAENALLFIIHLLKRHLFSCRTANSDVFR